MTDATTRLPPQLCHRCGYLWDAATAISGDHVPRAGDFTLCLNCAAIGVMRDGRWQEPTPADLDTLDPIERRRLTIGQAKIAFAKARGMPDLTGDDPHA